MTTPNPTESAVLDRIDATKDAVTVKRVFGDAYHHDGVTVIPVAAVRGAAGGGAGTGPDSGEQAGSGGGMGYALSARPIGVYVVHGDTVTWRPAVDVARVVLAGQTVLLGLIVGVVTLRRRIARMASTR